MSTPSRSPAVSSVMPERKRLVAVSNGSAQRRLGGAPLRPSGTRMRRRRQRQPDQEPVPPPKRRHRLSRAFRSIAGARAFDSSGGLDAELRHHHRGRRPRRIGARQGHGRARRPRAGSRARSSISRTACAARRLAPWGVDRTLKQLGLYDTLRRALRQHPSLVERPRRRGGVLRRDLRGDHASEEAAVLTFYHPRMQELAPRSRGECWGGGEARGARSARGAGKAASGHDRAGGQYRGSVRAARS